MNEATFAGGTTERAYTVASLADHWDCSEGVIRKLIKAGTLEAFYLGTAIRIDAVVVRRYELGDRLDERADAQM